MKIIIKNKKANYSFYLKEKFSSGIVLEGWEVKSIKEKNININDGYAVLRNSELWLINSIVTPLINTSTHFIPIKDRSRKLLLNRKEINKITGFIKKSGFSIIPTSVFLNDKNIIKIELWAAVGKKKYDKRRDEAEKDWKKRRDIAIKKFNIS